MTSQTIDIRVSPPGRIEDHHRHLLRLHYLDRCLHFASGHDDRAIDAHCLRLMNGRAILIGAYVDGVQRGAVEIIPDRAARRAQAMVTMEQDFRAHTLMQALVARAAEEARKSRLGEIHFLGIEMIPQPRDFQIARRA